MRVSATAALEPMPFARLPHLALPPRVRGLIEGIFQVLQPFVDGGLERALDDLERDLMAHLDRTQQSDEQLFAVASLRELKRHRLEFVHASRCAIQRFLLAMVHADTAATLALDDLQAGSAREEQSTLAQVAARAEIRAAVALQELGWRLGLIAGSPPIDLESLPLGPRRLIQALVLGARRLALDPAHRTALFRRIDKTLFAEAQPVYAALNRYLVEHRVYAHLKTALLGEISPPPRHPEVPAAAPRAQTATEIAAPPVPVPSEPAAPARAPVRPAAEPAPPAASAPPPAADDAEDALLRLWREQSEEQQRQSLAQARAAADVPLDLPFFRTLRELVAARRRISAAPETPGDRARPLAQTADLVAALGVLQRQPATPVMVAGKWANRSIAHIRQDLLNQLRGRDGITPRLRDEDQDTVDLVGFLFDRLLAGFPGNSLRHALLSRMQVLILRVALRDPSFFPRRTHPSRRLLAWLAEGLAHWVEDEDVDHSVIEKLQGVVDRLADEYRDTLEPFDQAIEEVERQVGALHRKAEIAERRHVEAARGREKLDLAQAAAEEAVRERLAGGWLPGAAVSLLQNAWVDAVALAMLRQGVDHPQTHERLDVIDRLIDAFIPQRSVHARHHALEELRPDLEEGLAAIGFHDQAIATAWTDIAELVDAMSEDAQQAAQRKMDELIRQRPRLGGGARMDDAGDPQPLPELGAEEREARARIEQLPFGTWLEFAQKPPLAPLRRRLCWFSAVTGRCVLLSPRGGRHEEVRIEQLARDWARQRVRLLEFDQDHLIDRTWREIMAVFRGAAMRDSRT